MDGKIEFAREKAACKHVDKFELCSQFHQHFTASFFANFLLPKN